VTPFEAEIALAASPRDWAQRLHRHIADHGGARVRATVLQASDALDESYDVLLADDTTSFLTPHLVEQLRRRGRRVLGVFDADDPRGKEELLQIGVDDAIERNASPEEFLAAISLLASRSTRVGAAPLDGVLDRPGPGGDAPPRTRTRGHIAAVGGPSGGVGATEIAIGLGVAATGRGETAVVVDCDEVAPSLAQRLNLALYPNLRVAVDAVERRNGRLAGTLTPVAGGPLTILPGVSNPRDWTELRPGEAVEVVRQLAMLRPHVVVNVGHRTEDLAGQGGPPRYAQTRGVLAAADAVVGVGIPTPVGVGRLLEWVAEISVLTTSPIHLILNKTPSGSYRRAEVEAEIRRSFSPASLRFVPYDARVEVAGWAGDVVRSGPFAKAVASAASAALPRMRGAVIRARRGRLRR